MGLFTGTLYFPLVRRSMLKRLHGKAAAAPANRDANHLFANNVRFLSMIAIIAVHTSNAYPVFCHQEPAPLALLCLLQTCKFGTIAFFLVAGFLLGERIERYSSLQYYARRLKNVFLPWLVWYLLYCALRNFCRYTPSSHPIAQISAMLWDALPGSTYWFVPNLLIALAVLLIFRPFFRDIRMGLVFLAASLFYAANIYGHWIAVEHTRAVFGFVFYLWLGAWASWHFATIERWLLRIRASVLIAMLLATGVLAMAETMLLRFLHSADPMNSLRLSNQLYSVAAVLAIMKLRREIWPRFVDVRAHTYGLYLTHSIVLAVLIAAVKRIPGHLLQDPFRGGAPEAMLLLPMAFAVTYLGCLLVVRVFLSTRWLRWTVGVGRGMRRAASARQAPVQDVSALAGI
jgi:peptidoglycan/LPS O-acetylase OafA/YrhL